MRLFGLRFLLGCMGNGKRMLMMLLLSLRLLSAENSNHLGFELVHRELLLVHLRKEVENLTLEILLARDRRSRRESSWLALLQHLRLNEQERQLLLVE